MYDTELLHLWGDGTIRAFISHTHPNKIIAAELQRQLRSFGIASFVAHNDIEPMREWQIEIGKALRSMDFLIALLSQDFRQSEWTDQEVGAAVGRGLPVFPVRIDIDPYGFMAKYQAIPYLSNSLAPATTVSWHIFRASLRDPSVDTASIWDLYVAAVHNSGRYARTDELARSFPGIESLDVKHAHSLLQAYNSNNQVSGAGSYDEIILQIAPIATGKRCNIVRNPAARGQLCVPVAQVAGE